jgi:hypothetical protein
MVCKNIWRARRPSAGIKIRRPAAGFTEFAEKDMAIAAEKGQSNVAVKTFQKPDDAPTELIRAFLVAMASPTSIYGAAMNSGPEDKSRTLLGDPI